MVINLNLKIESQNLEAELVSTLYEFYLRHHLGKTNELIEILWIEVQGRNKNTPVLSSNGTEKLISLETFERILTGIYTK